MKKYVSAIMLLFMLAVPFSADSKQYIDLHIHLDGAITPNIAKELAALQGIDVPNDEELLKLLTVSDDCKSLKSSGIKGNLILCCMRGADPEKNYETVEIARKYLVEDG